jgi:serine protease Do
MNRSLVCLTLLLACGPVRGESPVSAARALGGAFAEVYDKVAPSVVVLEVAKDERPSGADAFAWEFLFRDQRTPERRPRVEESEGSGFIIREDGYILTNAHVVEGADPERGVVARRQDGTRMPLRIIGVDDKTDLAVLKADEKGLPAVKWGDSDVLRVGEFVCSIGAPFELDYTLTAGIISAKGRSNLTSTVYEDYLQTDAAINPGNSGGPLCDLDGRVIGVNTLINGLSRGLGFAIPSKIARAVSDELIARGRVMRPWLGIRIETLGESPALQQMMGVEQGVLVRTIEPDAPAARSELQPADVIVAVDGQEVNTARDLQQTILGKQVGQALDLKVWRRGAQDGAYRTISVTTEELPQDPLIARRGRPAVPPSVGGNAEPAVEAGPLGLRVQDIPEAAAAQMGLASTGVIVTHVEPGSPAALAGLELRDVITGVGPNSVRDTATFEEAMANLGDAAAAVLLVEREGKKTYAILKP